MRHIKYKLKNGLPHFINSKDAEIGWGLMLHELAVRDRNEEAIERLRKIPPLTRGIIAQKYRRGFRARHHLGGSSL